MQKYLTQYTPPSRVWQGISRAEDTRARRAETVRDEGTEQVRCRAEEESDGTHTDGEECATRDKRLPVFGYTSLRIPDRRKASPDHG